MLLLKGLAGYSLNNANGNIKGNRIVVKCIEIGEKSKLWVAVAGNDRIQLNSFEIFL